MPPRAGSWLLPLAIKQQQASAAPAARQGLVPGNRTPLRAQSHGAPVCRTACCTPRSDTRHAAQRHTRLNSGSLAEGLPACACGLHAGACAANAISAHGMQSLPADCPSAARIAHCRCRPRHSCLQHCDCTTERAVTSRGQRAGGRRARRRLTRKLAEPGSMQPFVCSPQPFSHGAVRWSCFHRLLECSFASRHPVSAPRPPYFPGSHNRSSPPGTRSPHHLASHTDKNARYAA